MSITAGIALSNFYFLNPQINSNCTNLWLGNAYCVAPVGDISTYPGYPQTTPLITVTSASFPPVDTGIPTASSSPGYVATTSLLPTASGTIPGCDTYKNANGSGGHDSCSDISANYLVSVDQLQKWNPSLSKNPSDCSLQPGFSYCVVQNSTENGPSPNYCLSVNATMPSTISSCTCFTAVQGYLAGGRYTDMGRFFSYKVLTITQTMDVLLSRRTIPSASATSRHGIHGSVQTATPDSTPTSTLLTAALSASASRDRPAPLRHRVSRSPAPLHPSQWARRSPVRSQGANSTIPSSPATVAQRLIPNSASHSHNYIAGTQAVCPCSFGMSYRLLTLFGCSRR